MTLFISILKIIFGILFIVAGYLHFAKPNIFKHFIPDFLPKTAINYVVGFIELILGLGLFFNQTSKEAALSIFFLLIAFLPIHIWDVTKKRPAIGSKKIAIIRISLQFLFMYCMWIIYTKS